MDAATRAGVPLIRVDQPADLPAAFTVRLVLVDWAQRGPEWAKHLAAWQRNSEPGPRVVLFGPHTDLAAHAEARAAGLGPMLARSNLLTHLDRILNGL